MRTASMMGLLIVTAVFLDGNCSSAGVHDPERNEKTSGFVKLFDGKTLDGWQGATKYWSVDNGVLVYRGIKKVRSSRDLLDLKLMSKKQYADFILRFEFKLTARANNGVAIRSPLQGDPAFVGMEIQIIDTPRWQNLKNYQVHGSIYGVVPAKRGHLKPVGQWNSEEIYCQGNRIKVTLNGTLIVDADVAKVRPIDGRKHPGLKRERGHIGLLGHTGRVEFRNVRIKTLAPAAVNRAAHKLPYPPSPVIRGIEFDWKTRKELAPGSDNWPITWAKDGQQYTSWGDGRGFGGTNSDGRVSLGVARVIGGWNDYRGQNIWGGKNAKNRATFGGKSYGILAVDDKLYMWLRQVDRTHAMLAVSADAGGTWKKADWSFRPAGKFNTATFLQFGPGYTKTRDSYVYSYFIRTEDHDFGFVIHRPGKIDLARVPKDKVLDRKAYEFFAGFDSTGKPRWTQDVKSRRPVFEDPRGVSWVLSVTYNAGLKRYLLSTEHNKWQSGSIGVFDAPEPWGPWTTIPVPRKFPGWTFTFSNKWTSADGTRFTVVFTPRDSWATVRGRFVLD